MWAPLRWGAVFRGRSSGAHLGPCTGRRCVAKLGVSPRREAHRDAGGRVDTERCSRRSPARRTRGDGRSALGGPAPDSSGRLTAAEIRDLVGQLKGIVAILANADAEDRKAVYSELNLAVVYHDDGRMQVSAGPDACTNECVGGGT